MISQTALRYDEQDWQPRPTLSGADYTSDGVYDDERERIWWGDWVCIGREEELPNPGDYIVRDLTGESVSMFDRFKLDELRIGVRIVYEVEANWKIVVENYNECLHCPTVHPELVQVVPLFRFGEVWDEVTRDDGNWMREGATSFTQSGA